MRSLRPALAAVLAAGLLAVPVSAAPMDPLVGIEQGDEALNRAIALYRDGRYEESARSAETFLQFSPNSARGREVLGASLGRLGRMDEALAALDEAVRLDPQLATAHANRAVVLAGLGRLPEAREALETALRLQPDLTEAQARLGLVLEAQGDLDGAALA